MSVLNKTFLIFAGLLVMVLMFELFVYYNPSIFSKNQPVYNQFNFNMQNKSVDTIAFSKLLNLYLLANDDSFVEGQISAKLKGYVKSINNTNGIISIYLDKGDNSSKYTTMYFQEKNVKLTDKNNKNVELKDIKTGDLVELNIIYAYKVNTFLAEVKKLQ